MFDAAPSPFSALPLDDDDRALLDAARQTILKHHAPQLHTVGAALRGRDGRVWTGLHLGTVVGRLAVCAEAVALGRAILEGDGSVATIVAMRHPKPGEDSRDVAVVSPCGACRELLVDHDPEAWVIVPGLTAPVKLPVRALLPLPYRR